MTLGNNTIQLMVQIVKILKRIRNDPSIRKLADCQIALSRIPKSVEKRLKMVPIGVLSKKLTADLVILVRIWLWRLVFVFTANQNNKTLL